MNGNKNSKKNEDEFAKSAHVKQRERERKKFGHLGLIS